MYKYHNIYQDLSQKSSETFVIDAKDRLAFFDVSLVRSLLFFLSKTGGTNFASIYSAAKR